MNAPTTAPTCVYLGIVAALLKASLFESIKEGWKRRRKNVWLNVGVCMCVLVCMGCILPSSTRLGTSSSLADGAMAVVGEDSARYGG